jgi:hypothetical protein
LSGWVARNSRPQATAVAGFDITFSPVKSVSVLWALAPRAVAENIEAAHHAAVETAMRWLEEHAIFTRLGRNGIRQVDVEGLVSIAQAAVSGGRPATASIGSGSATKPSVLSAIDPDSLSTQPGQTLIADKNYFGAGFETLIAQAGLRLLRPARKSEPERPGARLFKPLRQIVESINQTFKGQLDLERHGGRTPASVNVRVLQRLLALTAAIWHNDKTGAPIHRSLTAYDH